MTILHYVPKIDKNTFPCELLTEMADGGMDGVSSHIMTSGAGDASGEYAGMPVHRLSPYAFYSVGGRRKFAKIAERVRPDVVHVHSLWDFSSWIVFKWAEELRLPIVLSPYKGLMEWNFRHHYALSKFPRLMLAQRYMLIHASALHAVTRQELGALRSVSWHPALKTDKPLNGRLCLVALSKAVDGASPDTARVAAEMKALYRKVIDSNPFLVMSAADREAENMLLAYGTALMNDVDDDRIFLDKETIRNHLAELSPESWRRILLHSSDQGILAHVSRAAGELLPEMRIPDVGGIDRFCKPAELPFLEAANPRVKVARMHQLENDYSRYEKECRLCVMLLNTRHLYAEGKLSRRNLASLYAAVRFEEYNDYVLENMLEEIGMKKFSSRVFYILHEFMMLEEGFMPFGMTCDRRTRQMIRKLFKSNIQ